MSQAYGRCIPGLQLQRNTRSSLTILNEVTLKLVQVTENTDLTHWYFIHQGISQVHKMPCIAYDIQSLFIHTCMHPFIHMPQCPDCRARKENSKAALLAWGEIRASCCTGSIFSASYLQSAGTNAYKSKCSFAYCAYSRQPGSSWQHQTAMWLVWATVLCLALSVALSLLGHDVMWPSWLHCCVWHFHSGSRRLCSSSAR